MASCGAGTPASCSGDVYLSSLEALEITTGTAGAGSFNVTSAYALALDTLTASTTIGVTSTGSSITIGSATSGGTQTIGAQTNLTFNALTTNGAYRRPGQHQRDRGRPHPGDKRSAAINPPTEVSAYGSATLIAGTTITGDTLSTTNGAATLTTGSATPTPNGGNIDWTTLTVATTLKATSNDGNIDFATATSGGTQTIYGYRQCHLQFADRPMAASPMTTAISM